jgi:hypothetical protein
MVQNTIAMESELGCVDRWSYEANQKFPQAFRNESLMLRRSKKGWKEGVSGRLVGRIAMIR